MTIANPHQSLLVQHEPPVQPSLFAATRPLWLRFVRQISLDLRLWLLGVGLLQLFRVALIWSFNSRVGAENSWNDYGLVFWVGFRFDAQTSAWFATPSFFASLACLAGAPERLAERVRAIFLGILVTSCVLVGGVDVGYFREFNDQFNHYAFGVLYDDLRAVLVTVWRQQPVVKALLGVAFVSVILNSIGRRWLKWRRLRDDQADRATKTWGQRLGILALSLMFLTGTLRGSVLRRPIQQKDAAVTRDAMLNKMTLNPFSAARYAITSHRRLMSGRGLEVYLADGDVREAAQRIVDRRDPLQDLDEAFQRIARGPKGTPPKHVFLIVMESYDAWPTLARYQSLGLSERLMDLGRRGIFSRKFLSASDGTMSSFAAILTGLMDTGVITNYQPQARRPFPSSINPILQSLGLRTRMFLGGYSSWQRSDRFCLEQGFQELYFAPHYSTVSSRNEWGPDDRELFDFVLRAVNPRQPSFNLVLTSSYHPPFSVDVYAKGFPHREVPADLKPHFSADKDYLRILGHLWYADQMLGEFVEEAERRFPDALFVITGDHTSRRFINNAATLYERTAVPFVMYGPRILEGLSVPDDLVGSHHDMLPTVIEMLAPQGFVYHAVGQDLLAPERAPIAIGRDTILGPDFVASRLPDGEIGELPGLPLPRSLSEISRLRRQYQSLLGVVWWRICRGATFPEATPTEQPAPVTSLAIQPHEQTTTR